MRQAGERSQSLRPQRALVKLGMDRQQRAAFHPAVADAKIPRQPLRIVSGKQELIRLPQAVPLLLGEGHVAARHHVIVHGDDVQRRRIGGSVWVGIVGEPGNEVCALGNFVRDLAIGALILAQKIQRRAGGAKIAFCVERQRSPQRIAAEKPGEARALAAA